MQNNTKVALFDFCETLVNFQTADAYVDYVREVKRTKIMLRKEKWQKLFRRIRLIQIIEKITCGKYSLNKRLKLWQLKGLSSKELEILAQQYYMIKIKPNLIPEMNKILLDLKKDGYAIYLVSGGYDIYLKHFVEEFGLDGYISSKIKMVDEICEGCMEGMDCLRDNKTILLDLYFERKPQYSVAFSDSVTDLPLLQWVDKGFVVSKEQHQSWSNIFKLEEIVWTEKRKF